MKPFMDRRLYGPKTDPFSWLSEGILYKFKENFGCLQLKRLNIEGTNYPKFKCLTKLDVTRINSDTVLKILILLENLTELKWPNLMNIILSYKKIVEDLCSDDDLKSQMKLKLLKFSYINTYSDKITSVLEYCPSISNFRLVIDHFDLDHIGIDPAGIDPFGFDQFNLYSPVMLNRKNLVLNKIFNLKNLRNFTAEWMDDSQLFRSKIE